MLYQVRIEGISPLIMHNGAAGLDTRSPANREKAQITKKTASSRTESDEDRLRELECQTSLWLDSLQRPTIPESAIRANLEKSARKSREGGNVREGLIVMSIDNFIYDKSLGVSVEELCKNVQFTVGVVVQRARVLRTRAKFDEWGCIYTLDCDPELVDLGRLETWLDIGGRRIGLGDWRPEKSGQYGRFSVYEIKEVPLEIDRP